MKHTETILSIIQDQPDVGSLWEGRYKIPWNDPDFSRRMLKEHLTQDHDLASRKTDTIDSQVAFINDYIAHSNAAVLDIGCGPGLYIERLLKNGHSCRGIDFSPASIEYARDRLNGRADIVEGDVRTVEFGNGFNAAMMLYGELNVFSPDECRQILKKAHDALSPAAYCLSRSIHTKLYMVSALRPEAGIYRSPACLDCFPTTRISASLKITGSTISTRQCRRFILSIPTVVPSLTAVQSGHGQTMNTGACWPMPVFSDIAIHPGLADEQR